MALLSNYSEHYSGTGPALFGAEQLPFEFCAVPDVSDELTNHWSSAGNDGHTFFSSSSIRVPINPLGSMINFEKDAQMQSLHLQG